MTRDEAIDKVSKLLRLAHGSTSPEEADSAQSAAQKIAEQHQLTREEIDTAKYSGAHDDLLSALEAEVSSRASASGAADLFGAAGAVREVIAKLRGAAPAEKSKRFRQARSAIKILSTVMGRNDLVRAVRRQLDAVVKKNDLS